MPETRQTNTHDKVVFRSSRPEFTIRGVLGALAREEHTAVFYMAPVFALMFWNAFRGHPELFWASTGFGLLFLVLLCVLGSFLLFFPFLMCSLDVEVVSVEGDEITGLATHDHHFDHRTLRISEVDLARSIRPTPFRDGMLVDVDGAAIRLMAGYLSGKAVDALFRLIKEHQPRRESHLARFGLAELSTEASTSVSSDVAAEPEWTPLPQRFFFDRTRRELFRRTLLPGGILALALTALLSSVLSGQMIVILVGVVVYLVMLPTWTGVSLRPSRHAVLVDGYTVKGPATRDYHSDNRTLSIPEIDMANSVRPTFFRHGRLVDVHGAPIRLRRAHFPPGALDELFSVIERRQPDGPPPAAGGPPSAPPPAGATVYD